MIAIGCVIRNMQDYKNTLVDNIPCLRRYARALTNNYHLADRIVQQCIDCAADLRQFVKEEQDKAAQRVWLYSIFHNIYNEFLNEQSTRIAQFSSDDSHGDGGDFEHDEYHRALAQLPLQQKQIFLLVSVEKFLYEEVSKIVNMPLGAILSLLHTARNSIVEQVYAVPSGGAINTRGIDENNGTNRSVKNNSDEAVELSL